MLFQLNLLLFRTINYSYDALCTSIKCIVMYRVCGGGQKALSAFQIST